VLHCEKWIPTKRSPINSYVSKAKAKAKQKGEEVRGEVIIKTATGIFEQQYLSKAAFDCELVYDNRDLKFLGSRSSKVFRIKKRSKVLKIMVKIEGFGCHDAFDHIYSLPSPPTCLLIIRERRGFIFEEIEVHR
jgi:hypothetical protein